MAAGSWDSDAVGLYVRFTAGEVSPREMAAELPVIWRYRSDRDPLGSDAAWRAMFGHAGYFTWAARQPGGRHAHRPLRSRRLFRGASADRRFGMSWTSNPNIARHFARYRQPTGADDGQVWVGVFAPSRLLGTLHHEREYLVDAVGVEVELWRPDTPTREL